jgi:hypothetical protein
MNKETSGLLWPLQLVFVITFGLGLIALFNPQVFGAQVPPADRTIAGNLLFAAAVTAVLLYAPRIWIWMRTPNFPAVAQTIDATRAALTDAANGGEKLDLIRTELGELRTRVDAIAALLNTGAIRTTLDTVTAQLNTTANQFNAGGDVRQRLDAIAAQFNAGGGIRTTLDAINAKLP